MSTSTWLHKEPIWIPDGKNKSGENMRAFIKSIEEKHNLKFSDYWDFHKWTVENIAEFWAGIWDFSGVIHSKAYDRVVDLSIPMENNPKWFEGAKLNYAENLLRFKDSDRTAFIVTGEDRKEPEYVSYKELYEETRIYASALRKIALQKGDIVTCYMSNRKEAVVAMLAAVSIGAIWTGCLPTLSAEEYIKRVKQMNPKIFFTVDEFPQMGKTIDLLKNIKEIVKGLPSLEKVLIVSSKPKSKLKNIGDIRNSCFLDDFLETSKDADGGIPKMVFEQVSVSHPVFINFTSGTTGFPKTLVHGSGMYFSMFRDYELHCGSSKETVIMLAIPVGWVAWNMIIHFLSIHSTIVVYEGVPFFLSPSHLWDLHEKFKITTMVLTPLVANGLLALNYLPSKEHKLNSMDIIHFSGGPLKQCNYEFLLKIKKGIQFINSYGCTELMVTCFICDSTIPVYIEEVSSPSLGISFECLDEEGNPVIGELGELVITKPIPSLALGFWGDSNGYLFKKTYFSKYPGKFATGDMVVVNPVTKGVIFRGRRSDIINQNGCRFACTEIYNIVNVFPEIQDSICIGQTKGGEERAVLFLKLKKDHTMTEKLVQDIRERISEELTMKHVPEVILQAPDIPYNANGKKTEIVIKKILNKMPLAIQNVENQQCLKFYYDVAERLAD